MIFEEWLVNEMVMAEKWVLRWMGGVMKIDRIRNDIIRDFFNKVKRCWFEHYGHVMGRGE